MKNSEASVARICGLMKTAYELPMVKDFFIAEGREFNENFYR
jgi:hypothetical protein